jgi:hypothetical protein
MATAGPRPTIRWRTVRVDHPSGPCVLGDGGLRRHSRVRARVGDRLAAAATGAPARLRAALASVHRHGGRRSSASPHSRRSASARTPPGRRVISLGADPSGRLIRWRNRAGHGGGDRQPRVLRSDGDSEGLQIRPSTVWNVRVCDTYIRDCTNRSSRAISSLAFKTCLQPPIIPSTRSGGTRSPDWSPAVDAVVHSRPKRRRASTSTTTAQVTGDRAETRTFARKNWFASSVRFSSRYGFRLSSPGSWQRCFARANPTRRSSSEHRGCGCNSSRCCFDRNWTESTKTG